MLVLTRRIGESVLIGGEVTVTVLDVKGDSIRIGVDAPRSTRIQRAEIVEAVSAENVSAVAADPGLESALRDALARRRAPDA
ncbi:carbon storage regulator [Microbacterium protaetiae]|uniref:Translational regulator CsrA n=1 Tax=Microbacterium protaetiae TaxID=2509458 RepID=A0A4P6EFY0_9MICO|nr:carbon storage regulator CsrA [Microbacterium protaetiae]QAY60059.1 carbon storage regulator [Microbacterium protaetiae]